METKKTTDPTDPVWVLCDGWREVSVEEAKRLDEVEGTATIQISATLYAAMLELSNKLSGFDPLAGRRGPR